MKIKNKFEYYKDLGKYCIDMSKVIATSVVVVPFVQSKLSINTQLSITMALGGITAILLLFFGLILSHSKKTE
jgi:hypothetical protein